MSTKFNRNDSHAADDRFYLDDYRCDLNGVEEDQRTALVDLHAMPCIIKGLAVTVNAGDDTLFDVAAGIAYDRYGYRVEVPAAQTGNPGADTTAGAENYLCLRHKYTLDVGRAAYKTGMQYNTRKYDDFEIVIRTEAEGLQDGDICLGLSTGNGSGISVSTDNRVSPDYGGAADTTPPMTVTGVALATGAESSLVHSAVAAQLITDGVPVRAWIKVTWNQVSDPAGIREYQVEMVPLDNSDNELPEYLITRKVAYAPTAPGGPQYST